MPILTLERSSVAEVHLTDQDVHLEVFLKCWTEAVIRCTMKAGTSTSLLGNVPGKANCETESERSCCAEIMTDRLNFHWWRSQSCMLGTREIFQHFKTKLGKESNLAINAFRLSYPFNVQFLWCRVFCFVFVLQSAFWNLRICSHVDQIQNCISALAWGSPGREG